MNETWKIYPELVLLLFLDVRAAHVTVVSSGALVLLLAVIFVLAVSFSAALVVLLIWLKGRKTKQTQL